jgi:hypothetical protein
MDSSRFDEWTRGLARAASRRRMLGMLGGGFVAAVTAGRQSASAGPAKIALCHATGDPANPYTVMEVPEPALDAHMAHGDTPYVNCCLDAECPVGETCGGRGIPGQCGGCPTLTTCAAQGVDCGSIPDGCGGPDLDCGGCGTGDICTGPETCSAGLCHPGAPLPCPPPDDSCYAAAACDPSSGCGEPTYRGDGVPCDVGVCYQEACCTPATCADLPCGQDIDDGCGSTIDCGVPVPDADEAIVGCAIPCGNGTICQTVCGTEATCMSLGGDGLGQICRVKASEQCTRYGFPCSSPGSVCHRDITDSIDCYEVCYAS